MLQGLLAARVGGQVGRADNMTRPRMRSLLRKSVIFFENKDDNHRPVIRRCNPARDGGGRPFRDRRRRPADKAPPPRLRRAGGADRGVGGDGRMVSKDALSSCVPARQDRRSEPASQAQHLELTAQIAMIISAARQSTQAPAARSRSSATGKKEITRALSACPPSVASEAAASVIDESGYVNVWTGASANACTSADIRPQLAIRHWAPFPEDYGERG